MDMELVLSPSARGAEPAGLSVRTRDGRVLELAWDDAMVSIRIGGTVRWTLLGLRCPAGGNCPPDEADLRGAELADASWSYDDDGNPRKGRVEILSATALSPDGGRTALAGLPGLMPLAIDYAKLDRGVREAVRYFNACGLRTEASYGRTGLMKIFFHPSVRRGDLKGFPGGQPCKGSFCALFQAEDREKLAYVAAAPADVSYDLAKWMLRYPAPGKEGKRDA